MVAERAQRGFDEIGLAVGPLPRVLTRMKAEGELEHRPGDKGIPVTPEVFAGRIAPLLYQKAWVSEVGEDGLVEIIVVEHLRATK